MTSYKNYLYIRNDDYQVCQLKKYIGQTNFWKNISRKACKNACYILNANVNNITLNDKYNETVAKEGKNARVDINNPITLFSPYCMTYDPDILQIYPIGWPIRDKKVQDKGYETVQQGKPSCISFCQNKFLRQSPYTSHCSAYVGWITQLVFGISLVPTQIGDWCHAAAEKRDIMNYLSDWWEKVDSTQAQYAANEGKLAIAAKKVDDPEREGYKQNGHIAVILPITWQIAKELQNKSNYPKTPEVFDETSFQDFILINGPEIAQSGGLNFSHTVAANGFANYYPSGSIPGLTPIDIVVEFYVYKLYTQH